MEVEPLWRWMPMGRAGCDAIPAWDGVLRSLSRSSEVRSSPGVLGAERQVCRYSRPDLMAIPATFLLEFPPARRPPRKSFAKAFRLTEIGLAGKRELICDKRTTQEFIPRHLRWKFWP